MADATDTAPPAMGGFERWLSVCVALAMVAGIAVGQVAQINFVVAVLIWAMVYPMMVGVDFGAVSGVARQPKGLLVTLAVNWLVKPFTMAGLAVLFFDVVFAPFIAPDDAAQYAAGLILLGAAPCTAMVFVWSQLTRGDETYTLVQVSVNDLIMLVAFAPIVALLLGVTEIEVPWETLVLATLLYVVLPLAAGLATRRALGSKARIEAFTARVKPASIIRLVATVGILFGLQGSVILKRPLTIVLIAAPILIQS